jgi:hypothetical protein
VQQGQAELSPDVNGQYQCSRKRETVLAERLGIGIEDINSSAKEESKRRMGEAEVDGDGEGIEVGGCRGKREL